MTQLDSRRLETNRVVPNFILTALDGREMTVREFKQRSNLVILYLDTQRLGPERFENYLSLLAGSSDDFRDLEARLLVLTSSPPEELLRHPAWANLPFTVLPNARDAMENGYLQQGSQVAGAAFVTDRYGALKAELLSPDGQDLPDLREVIGWLELIEMECPE